MWAKNDTLAAVTSCEVSPSADDCTGCSFAVVTPGNDAAPTGTTASKVAASSIVRFTRFFMRAARHRIRFSGYAPEDRSPWTRSERGQSLVRWNRSGYMGSSVTSI